MLNLILGRQLSGKTKYCTDLAFKLAKEGKQVIMLVPEQYSFECQKLLLQELGAAVSNRIEIHSFTSLCKEICTEIGGLSGSVVDDGVRYLLVGRALENVKDNLKYYARYVNSREFQIKISSLINELKQASISVESMRVLCEKVDSNAFSDKLSDVSLILSAYDALLENRFLEPLDIIDKTVERMHGSSFFKDKTVIIDEFKGFTESQKKLLGRIIAGSENVYVAFCCDCEIPSNETDIFKNVIKSVEDLKKTASDNGVVCNKPIILNYSAYNSAALKHLEAVAAQKSNEILQEKVSDVSVCRAFTVYDEVDFVMNRIRKLVREENYRYGDFVIISRNADAYSSLISDISDKYEIPCLTDRRISVSELPLSIYAVSAVKAAMNFETGDILRYLKTGFADVDFGEISKLENYAYIWSINGLKWLSDWTLNPEGLKDKEETKVFENKELNLSREKAITPIKTLKNGLCGTVVDMCKAVYRLICDGDTIEKLKKYTFKLEECGKLDDAEHQRAGYDILIKTLDKLCAVSGEDKVTPKQFVEMFSSALSFETVGEIPRTKDQVIFGSADRIRPMRPKVCFVIGANHDVFPMSVGTPDIFSVSERALMNENGIKLSAFDINDTLDEKFLFYYAVCCASHKVFISYASQSFEGSEMLASEEVEAIVKAIPKLVKTDYGFTGEMDLSQVEAPLPSFEKMAENMNGGELAVTLKEYFKEDDNFSGKLDALCKAFENREPQLSKSAARRLYGEELKLSPSRIEDFNRCNFAFFCKYGLGAKKKDKVDFSAATRGNIIHFCLEHFINNHKTDIGMLVEDDVYKEAMALCDEYLKKMGVGTEDVGNKFDYMLSLLKKTAAYICVSLNREFAQSEFKPRFCEFEIVEKKDDDESESTKLTVKPITFNADNGVKVRVEGTVDRVDTTDNGKVRVVDYKTGVKEFKLSQILDGVNFQMLIYLYTMVVNAKELLNADIPAGILYFPARKNMKDDVGSPYIKMNGLIDSDMDTVRQMEASGEGKIVPAHIRSEKSFWSNESVISVDGFKKIFKYLDKAIAQIGAKITDGSIERMPFKSGQKITCEYCDYRSVCRLNDETRFREEVKMKIAKAMEMITDNISKEDEE